MSIFQQIDKKIIWHPFTQAKTTPNILNIKKASGVYIYDENHKSYLDLISSWWVNLHGHAHPKIAEAIYQQAKKLEHVIFAGFTHEPAINLCQHLQTILPKKLCKFFFSDNGSTAVEVAVKMAYQYWHNLGFKNRRIFLSFDGGYHGDTFGAMSVGARSGFHEKFKDLLFKVLSIPYPCTWDNDVTVDLRETKAIKVLKSYLQKYKNNIAGIILEPMIQGASGMRICRSQFIHQVVKLIQEEEILIIFDEVMTGFGRTGKYFAYNHVGITPDFLCLSKGITGGFLPLALTITSNQIYTAFLSKDFKTAFAHGHSYTANPLACSAAIASFNLLRNSRCHNSIVNISKIHREGIALLKAECKLIEKHRTIGTIAAFDLKIPPKILPIIKQLFLAGGMLLRPLGKTVYLLPPYCISSTQLKRAYQKIIKIINSSNKYSS